MFKVLILSAAVLAGAPLVSSTVSQQDEDGSRVRGRPRSQIQYKGSSPYFKVDFDRYTGAISCVWCHPKASEIWRREESFHVNAYEGLEEEARTDPDCVRCHVTAFNQDGEYPFEDEEKLTARKLGFTWEGDPKVNRHFEGVQCEACHGPNCGNKYSREHLIETCKKCHNEESPSFDGFDVEAAMKRLKHAEVGAVEKIDYDTYTGLEACMMCHWPNYQAWDMAQRKHRDAYRILDEESRANPRCLKCHTTGFHQDGYYPLEEEGKRRSRRGGFAFGGDAEANARFLGVQCEACHGINCGTYTDVARIRKQCEGCHSGECEHDAGFDWKRDYRKVKHMAPAPYVLFGKLLGSPKVILDFYGWKKGRETAEGYRMPMLVVFSNPPDG